jgi:hypothetical protein
MDFPTGRRNLYLTEIGEPFDNQLRVVICEAVLGDPATIDEKDFKIENVRPMEVTDQSRFFELYWANYVAYAIRNESYWRPEEGEADFEGHLYQRLDSAFLRYVFATTFADNDYPGPLQNWALDTLNHCLDVVTTEGPEIRLLDPAEAGRRPTSINFAKGR